MSEFRIGGGLQNIEGAVPPEEHVLEQSNIERKENDKMNKKRLARVFDKFPMHVHKTGGMVREVLNDQQLEDALNKGWKADIRDVDVAEPVGVPDRASRMTIPQAVSFVAEHAHDAAKLGEIEADETGHGNRAAVVAAINEAKDNFGAQKPTKKAK